MANSSAFTSVQYRRTLTQPTNIPPAPAAPKPAFSSEVRDYVQRAFAQKPSSVAKPEVDAKLKEIIGKAMAQGDIDSIDWSRQPLPHELIQRDRELVTSKLFQQDPRESFTNFQQASNKHTSQTSVDKPKKRKSSDSADNSYPNAKRPASRQSPEKAMISPVPDPDSMEARITGDNRALSKREQKKQRKMKASADFLQDQAAMSGNLEKRRQRFGTNTQNSDSETIAVINRKPATTDGPVVGTSQILEKRYLRLTAPPKPETVRPLPILRQTLELLMSKWKLERNYGYTCDQFKSLRQDLTVQHIKNEFTVTVYERHARIALEKGDMGEYNQCQSQLRLLYKQKLGGNPAEFLAYRILYFLFTRNRGDITNALADVPQQYRNTPEVKHALKTRSALALGNFHRFFRLYHEAPNHGAWVLDMFIDRERLAALAALCKLYVTVDVKILTSELAFESEMECCDFICKHRGGDFVERQASTGVVIFKAKLAGPTFEQARRGAFRSVDIKGQI